MMLSQQSKIQKPHTMHDLHFVSLKVNLYKNSLFLTLLYSALLAVVPVHSLQSLLVTYFWGLSHVLRT